MRLTVMPQPKRATLSPQRVAAVIISEFADNNYDIEYLRCLIVAAVQMEREEKADA